MSDIIPGPGDEVIYISMAELKLRFQTVLADILQIQDVNNIDFKTTVDQLFTTFVSNSLTYDLVDLSGDLDTQFLNITGDLTAQNMSFLPSVERIVITAAELATSPYVITYEGWISVSVIHTGSGPDRYEFQKKTVDPSTLPTWPVRWLKFGTIFDQSGGIGPLSSMMYSTGDNLRIFRRFSGGGNIILYLWRYDQ